MTATSMQQQPHLLSTTIDVSSEVPLPVVHVLDPALSTTATTTVGYQTDRDDELLDNHDDEDDTPSIASFTDSSSEDDGINNNDGWLNDSSSPPRSSFSLQTYQIEFDAKLFDNEYDNQEQEFVVPVKGDDDEEADPGTMFGNRRRSGSLRGSFRAGSVRSGTVRGGSFRVGGPHPRVVEDDDSLVRNRMGREDKRRPSWSDNVLNIMGDDVDCIDVPMKDDD